MNAPAPQPRPTIAEPAPWSFPTAERFTLDSGLSVCVFQRPGQHVISLGLVADLPLSAEPRGLEGVAGLVAAALDQGTQSHPDTAFADAVESCGAVLDASAGYSSLQLQLDVPASRLAPALLLLSEAVSEPEISDSVVAREQGIHLAHLEQQLANGSSRADIELRRTLIDPAFRASRLRGGDSDSLARVTGRDARDFHAAHVHPHGATLVIAGETTGGIHDLVADAFGSWQPSEPIRIEHERPTAAGRSLRLVDRPGAVQADVRLGVFSLDRLDPQWAAFTLAVHAIGGSFGSRLNKVLREEKGYTYGVRASNSPFRVGGFTAISGSFRNDVVADAVSLVGPLVDVTDTPLRADEIDDARRYLVGVQPLQYATASGVCGAVSTLIGVGLDSTYVDALRAGLMRVTPAAASEAASRFLPSDQLSLVVVGDAETLVGPLRERGFDVHVEA